MKNLEKNPNIVLKAIEPFLSKKSELFSQKLEENTMLSFVGSGSLSDCYFKNVKYSNSQGKFIAQIALKPSNQNSVLERIYDVQLESIEKYLESWNTLIKERKRLFEVFSANARLEDITEEFFKESPYYSSNFENEYFSIIEASELSEVCLKLIEYVKVDNAIKNKEEIILEISSLEENTTLESKRSLAHRIAKIKALMIKNGPKVLKTISEIGVNVAGNVIAKLITG